MASGVSGLGLGFSGLFWGLGLGDLWLQVLGLVCRVVVWDLMSF